MIDLIYCIHAVEVSYGSQPLSKTIFSCPNLRGLPVPLDLGGILTDDDSGMKEARSENFTP